MTEIRRHEDGSLIIDPAGRSTAWLTPVRDATRPAVLAEVCVDDTDHEVALGRPELLAVREWIDERLALSPEPDLGHLQACVPAPQARP